LVEILPNRGARVVKLTLEDVKHLFEVIGGLESLAGRLACDQITDAEICEIKAIHYQMQAHFIRRDLPDYFRLNQAIHKRIVGAARKPVLSAMHEKSEYPISACSLSGKPGRIKNAGQRRCGNTS
jgi:DNA-binding GntR family transcriptional regulator